MTAMARVQTAPGCRCGLPGDVHLDPDGRIFHVQGHEAGRQVLDSDDFGVEYPFRASRQLFGPTVLDLDGPRHQRLRGAMAPPMRAALMAGLRGTIVEPVIRRALGELPVGEPFDFVQRVASVIPARVITGYLGVPEEHASYVYAKLRPIIDYINDPTCSLGEAVDARDALESLLSDYLDASRHRTSPSASGNGKGLNRLEADDRMRAAMILLAAGTETTIHALGLTLHLFLRRADLLDCLRSDFALIPTAVAELMRLTPPLTSTVRFARTDTTVAGCDVSRGAVVEVSLRSGNADPRVYADPEIFDFGRDARDEPRPLTFGSGRHVCPGAALAALEVQVLLELLLSANWPVEQAGPLGPLAGRTFLGPARLDLVLTRPVVSEGSTSTPPNRETP